MCSENDANDGINRFWSKDHLLDFASQNGGDIKKIKDEEDGREFTKFTAWAVAAKIEVDKSEIKVTIDENGRVHRISAGIFESNPHLEEPLLDPEECFTKMMEMHLPVFKAMLKAIKDGDPEMYEIGVGVLNSKREELIAEYTL